MILVDTGAWFALSVPGDPDHLAAKTFVEANDQRLLSTDYIVDELLTLFRVRKQVKRAEAWLNDVFALPLFDLVHVLPADFDRALLLYREFADKTWSFTDCTSFAVIERLSIPTAFSFDKHFRQVGSFQVVP